MYYLKRVILCPEHGESKVVGAVPDPEQSEETLWITDSSVKASELQDAGKAVLVWLHDENRDQDFSSFRYACDNPHDLDMDYLEGVYRRHMGIPWDILETERCLIRETTVADVEEFYRIYSDPSITKYMESLYEDPEEERAYARDYIDKVYSFYGFGIWTVVEKARNQVIGRAGICYREGYDDPELGFVIAAHEQGMGYATEVCRAIVQYGHEELGFERILAFVQPDNQASVRVCEKLKMQLFAQVEINGQLYQVYHHLQVNEAVQ